MMLGLSGVLAELFAWAVPVPGQCVTVGTELAYFSFQPGRQALAHVQIYSTHTSKNCCGETIELLGGASVKG